VPLNLEEKDDNQDYHYRFHRVYHKYSAKSCGDGWVEGGQIITMHKPMIEFVSADGNR